MKQFTRGAIFIGTVITAGIAGWYYVNRSWQEVDFGRFGALRSDDVIFQLAAVLKEKREPFKLHFCSEQMMIWMRASSADDAKRMCNYLAEAGAYADQNEAN